MLPFIFSDGLQISYSDHDPVNSIPVISATVNRNLLNICCHCGWVLLQLAKRIPTLLENKNTMISDLWQEQLSGCSDGKALAFQHCILGLGSTYRMAMSEGMVFPRVSDITNYKISLGFLIIDYSLGALNNGSNTSNVVFVLYIYMSTISFCDRRSASVAVQQIQ